MTRWFWIVWVLCAGQIAAAPLDDLKTLGVGDADAQALLQRWAERHPDQDAGALVAVVRQAAQDGAPVDLVVDKASEGLAKGVPLPRLLRVLTDWGNDLAQAARTVREMRAEAKSEDISEREAVLRLSMLQRLQKDQPWLDQLQKEARKNKVDLQAFLNVGEAVGHLTKQMGLEKQEAEQLGVLWMKQRMTPGDINKYVRAIEEGREQMPVAQATRIVVENILGGRSPDDLLRDIRDKQIAKDQRDLGAPSAGSGSDKEKGKPESSGSSEKDVQGASK